MNLSLAERREMLVARSRAERAALLAGAQPLLQKAAAADRMLTRVRQHPIAVTAIGAAIVFLGSRKLFDIATRVVTVYALFKR